MRPAYGMGRRSFSRPGALRFTAAPCSRLAKRRAVQQGGRPAITQQRSPASQQPPATGGAAPTSRLPRDRSRNGGQNRHGSHPAGPQSPAPSCINPPGHHAPPSPCITRRATTPRRPHCITRRATSARRPSPPGKARTSSPGSRRCACPTATSVLWWGHPGARRPLPSGKREPRPPARAAAHARPLHPFCGGATRRAPPSPLWETRTTPPARAAAHARPLHPFCGGATRRAPPSPLRGKARTSSPGSRRCACPTATSVPWAGPPGARRPPPSGKREPRPPARAAAHARPLHPFRGGATRRAPLRRGRRGAGRRKYIFSHPRIPLDNRMILAIINNRYRY